MKKMFAWGLVVPFALAAAACGGESSSDNTGGASGSGGATGGSGGAPTGGSGGVPTGGSGGVGGSGGAPTGPSGVVGECKSDADCQLESDCCNCSAAKKGTPAPPSCDLACEVDQCTAMGVTQARCIAGQCTIALNCDAATAACDSKPPVCEQGQVPWVQGTCWGGCVSALDCASVDSCFVCPQGSACIGNDAWQSDYHCVTPPAGCSGGCGCMGPLACIEPYTACSDGIKDGSYVHCSCPTC